MYPSRYHLLKGRFSIFHVWSTSRASMYCYLPVIIYWSEFWWFFQTSWTTKLGRHGSCTSKWRHPANLSVCCSLLQTIVIRSVVRSDKWLVPMSSKFYKVQGEWSSPVNFLQKFRLRIEILIAYYLAALFEAVHKNEVRFTTCSNFEISNLAWLRSETAVWAKLNWESYLFLLLYNCGLKMFAI